MNGNAFPRHWCSPHFVCSGPPQTVGVWDSLQTVEAFSFHRFMLSVLWIKWSVMSSICTHVSTSKSFLDNVPFLHLCFNFAEFSRNSEHRWDFVLLSFSNSFVCFSSEYYPSRTALRKRYCRRKKKKIVGKMNFI